MPLLEAGVSPGFHKTPESRDISVPTPKTEDDTILESPERHKAKSESGVSVECPTSRNIRNNQELLMLCNDSFSIARDSYHHCLFCFTGLLVIVVAVICIFFATLPDQDDPNVQAKRFVYFAGAVVTVALAMLVCLRFGTPTSIEIMRSNGAWSISLHRSLLPPLTRTLLELEAFVETFGYCGKLPIRFRGRRAGWTTSNDATMHLFFYRSLSSPPLRMSFCLQEPLAFLTKLRDIMTVTQHPLLPITTEYVADWDAATDDPSVTGTMTGTSVTDQSRTGSFSIAPTGAA